jgi:FKBP-type peptidyl-prolyl cis-trans isomerase
MPSTLTVRLDIWLTITIGWDEGVVQMKLGEKARLDITSDFAYGSQYVQYMAHSTHLI